MPLRYRQVVGAPSAPPRYSLFVVARRVEEEHRFTEGVEWLPESIGDGNISSVDGGSMASVAASVTGLTAASLLRSGPFALWDAEQASVLGAQDRNFAARVRRRLQASESFQGALELWNGAIATADGDDRQPFTSIDSDRLSGIGTPLSVVASFAAMEAGLASVLGGQRGMIHCTPQILAYAFQNECVLNAGSAAAPLWVTPMGHVVVADAGYTGDGPGAEAADSTSQWIMGTDLVRVRLGQVTVTPGDVEDVVGVDRDLNDVTIIARRPCVLEWNLNTHLSAEVNIGTVDIGGAS